MLIPEFDAGNGIVLPPVQVCDEDAFRLYEVLTHPKLSRTVWRLGYLCTSAMQLGFWFRGTEGFGYALYEASYGRAVSLNEFLYLGGREESRAKFHDIRLRWAHHCAQYIVATS